MCTEQLIGKLNFESININYDVILNRYIRYVIKFNIYILDLKNLYNLLNDVYIIVEKQQSLVQKIQSWNPKSCLLAETHYFHRTKNV